MIDLERAIQAVESGLLTANRITGRVQPTMTLTERLAYYQMPGFSIALIQEGEVFWAKGYGHKGQRASNMPFTRYQKLIFSRLRDRKHSHLPLITMAMRMPC